MYRTNYAKNYKMQMKEIKELKKWRNILYWNTPHIKKVNSLQIPLDLTQCQPKSQQSFVFCFVLINTGKLI